MTNLEEQIKTAHPDLIDTLQLLKRNINTIIISIGHKKSVSITLDNQSETEKIAQLIETQSNESIDLDIEIYRALHSNHVNVIKWFVQQGYTITNKGVTNYFSSHGNIDALQWLLENNLIGEYDIMSMDSIHNSECKQKIKILDWWLKSGLELKYSTNAVGNASCYGLIDVLQWWFTSGLEFKYDPGWGVSSSDHLFPNKETVDWWINSELEMDWTILISYAHAPKVGIESLDKIYRRYIEKNIPFVYDTRPIVNACYSVNNTDIIPILNWWLNSGLELKYDNNAFERVAGYGRTKEIQWWLDSGLPLKYNIENLIQIVFSCGQIDNIILLLDNGIIQWADIASHSPEAIQYACSHGHIDLLNWLVQSGIKLNYDYGAMDDASTNGEIKILDWWLRSGLELKYTEHAIDDHDPYDPDILKWWFKSGLELKYTHEAMDSLYFGKSSECLSLWKESGLELKYTTNWIRVVSKSCAYEFLKIIFESGFELRYDEHAFNFGIGRNEKWYNTCLATIHLWLTHPAVADNVDFIKTSIKKFAQINSCRE